MNWDAITSQELAIRHDDGGEFQQWDEVAEGTVLVRSRLRPWGTAILLNKKWAMKEWHSTETPNSGTITIREQGVRRTTITPAHLPEAWHHADDEYQAALENFNGPEAVQA